jgi:Glycosyl hydrolases family 16
MQMPANSTDTHSKNHSVDSDTFENFHTYEIDWKPDTLTWSIDGNTVRTLNRDDTWNDTANRFDYPQTPARVQLSIWPAGLASNGQGTVEWAGGLIDWNSPDVENAGYFYAQFKEVDIECYDPPSGADVKGSTSYIYTDGTGLNNTVEISDDQTVLGSLEDTGLNPTASAAASGTGTPNVPGMGTGGSGSSGDRGSGSGNLPASPSAFHGWSQGGSGSGATPLAGERTVQGSMLAVVIVIAALLIM